MPGLSEPVVRIATPADRDAVVATVVAAFDLDPAFRYFFDDDDFAAQAEAFVGQLFDRRVVRDAVWVVDDGDAVAMWDRPVEGWDGSAAPALPGLPTPVISRLQAWDDAVHDLLPTGPHWYLGILATRPDRAGEGLARLAVAPGLAAARTAGLRSWLETASAANVAMYERRGWTVAGAVAVDGVTCTVLVTG